MRLITFSLPGIALVAILSVSIQRSICYTRAQAETGLPPSPEVTQIFRLQLSKHSAERPKEKPLPLPLCLSTKAYTPVGVTVHEGSIVP